MKYIRYRGNMIEVFKIIKGIYDPTCVPHLDLVKLSDDVIRTRGTKCKLNQHHCCYDLSKLNFTNQVIPIWNSISKHVVSADTVNCFKNTRDCTSSLHTMWSWYGGMTYREICKTELNFSTSLTSYKLEGSLL